LPSTKITLSTTPLSETVSPRKSDGASSNRRRGRLRTPLARELAHPALEHPRLPDRHMKTTAPAGDTPLGRGSARDPRLQEGLAREEPFDAAYSDAFHRFSATKSASLLGGRLDH